MGLTVEPDNGPAREYLPGGSVLAIDESPESLIRSAMARLRASNRQEPSRAKSAAITKCEEAAMWLRAHERGEVR